MGPSAMVVEKDVVGPSAMVTEFGRYAQSSRPDGQPAGWTFNCALHLLPVLLPSLLHQLPLVLYDCSCCFSSIYLARGLMRIRTPSNPGSILMMYVSMYVRMYVHVCTYVRVRHA